MEELENMYLTFCKEVNYLISYEHFNKNIISNLKQDHIDILYNIKIGNLDKLKELHEFTYINYHKELPIRLAIKYEHLDILDYLIEIKYLNRNLSDIIAELCSPLFFNKIMEKYDDRLYVYPKYLLIKEWYNQIKYINIYECLGSSIRYCNKLLTDHIIKNYKLDSKQVLNELNKCKIYASLGPLKIHEEIKFKNIIEQITNIKSRLENTE